MFKLDIKHEQLFAYVNIIFDQWSFFSVFQVDLTFANGKAAPGVDLEIEAKTDSGDVVQERQQNAGGNGQNVVTSDEAGQGIFIVDVPKKFNINYLDIIVRKLNLMTRSHRAIGLSFEIWRNCVFVVLLYI